MESKVSNRKRLFQSNSNNGNNMDSVELASSPVKCRYERRQDHHHLHELNQDNYCHHQIMLNPNNSNPGDDVQCPNYCRASNPNQDIIYVHSNNLIRCPAISPSPSASSPRPGPRPRRCPPKLWSNHILFLLILINTSTITSFGK